MEKNDNLPSKSISEPSLAIPIPIKPHKRLVLQSHPYYHMYNPQNESEVSEEHRLTRRLMDHFEDKPSTSILFCEYALRVFEAVDHKLYKIWWTKIEVSMEEIFPILDELRYGRDTIALLAVVSPSSYRLLLNNTTSKYNIPHPTFTLENGMIGPPLKRKPDLDIRKATFYEEASEATLNNKTPMFTSFIAAQIQADFHGRYIAKSDSIRHMIQRLSDSTPDVNQLAIEYEVLSMIKNGPPPNNKICRKNEEVVYKYDDKKWYAFEKPAPEKRKVKVSASKKREDARKRMVKYRARKLADKQSYRSVSELHSTPSFRREIESRSASVSKKRQVKSAIESVARSQDLN